MTVFYSDPQGNRLRFLCNAVGIPTGEIWAVYQFIDQGYYCCREHYFTDRFRPTPDPDPEAIDLHHFLSPCLLVTCLHTGRQAMVFHDQVDPERISIALVKDMLSSDGQSLRESAEAQAIATINAMFEREDS